MTVPTHHALYSLAATLQGIEETLVADVLGFADRQNDPEMGTALEKRIVGRHLSSYGYPVPYRHYSINTGRFARQQRYR